MRIWEVENNNAMPSDLVREQDFIMRVRRMQRQGVTGLVLNFVLTAIEPLAKNLGLMEKAQQALQAYAQSCDGSFYEMSNGDAFIVWEKAGDARIMADRATQAALADYVGNAAHFVLTYRMPDGYSLLRERANHYVETVRAAAGVSGGFKGVDESGGHLTAKNVDQIEHLLGEIDLRRYGRTQQIYRDVGGSWQKTGEEYFISFEDLRRERFPKLEIVSSEHFFFAICGILDQKLLAMLTTSYEMIAGRSINLNLSIPTIMSSVFAQFVRRVPREGRANICFELHRGDLLQDFSVTLGAIEVLKQEGFRVALDSITPDMADYLNFDAFKVDAIKLNVSKDRVAQLTLPNIRAALRTIPAEKLIFFRCDSDRALKIGREMGVSVFQGWLIDDLIAKKK